MEAMLLSGGRSSGGWVANSLITCLMALPRFECTANCEQRSEKSVCAEGGRGRGREGEGKNISIKALYPGSLLPCVQQTKIRPW